MIDQSIEAQKFLHKNVHVNCGPMIHYLLSVGEESFIGHEWYEDLFLASSEEDYEEYSVREPYEFYIVDEYLAMLLKNQNCLLTDYFGFWIWGRETTGQSILLDHVFQAAWQQHNN